MVAPTPDLYRKFRNTSGIVEANKSQFIPNLYVKYPRDYVDINTHRAIEQTKPWIEQISSNIRLSNKSSDIRSPISSLQPLIPDKILVLAVDFSDKPAQISIEQIYNRFFSDIGNSLKNYYRENSYSQYIPEGDVGGWYRAPHDSGYYTDNNYGFRNYPNNVQKLVEDVINIASTDPNINWRLFDTNNDSYLTSIIIVHSGAEAASTGDVNDFWAHVWEINPIIVQGKTISIYAITSEYIYLPSDTQRTGVDSHEYGHLLGLPDLYDYSGNSNGVGYYSLMGSGSWTNGGITPVHLDAWSKYKLGYTDTIVNPRGLTYIGNAETNPNNYKYTTLDPKEFFMIENRRNLLFDTYLPSEGILIWHINENQQYNNNENCFLVGLIQADGFKDLENKINDGDLGDSYPGLTNNRSFGRYTNPNSLLCNGTTKEMLINNISDSSNIMSFDSTLPPPIGSIQFNIYPPGADIYFDTTYKNTTDINTGTLTINNIPVGTINYTIKKIGYFNRTGSIEVLEDQTVIVSAILTSLPTTGILDIISNPIGAKIYIDYKDTGYTTPATIEGILEGDHTYKLTLIEYEDKIDTFTIIAGETTNIDAGDLIQIPTVVQAGFSPVQIIIMTGLVVGAIYSSMIKPKIEQR